MTRLQIELNRLYFGLPPDAGERSRVMVVELGRPSSWAVLGLLWQGVQSALELPAPAIAVSGVDGLQLWFSVDEPIPCAQAQAFLRGLCRRFLPEVAAERLRLMPAPDRPVPRVPARQASGDWSAFVAPDLAAVFAETPWLDVEPNEEGQAALLQGLRGIDAGLFEASLTRLQDIDRPSPEAVPGVPPAEPVDPVQGQDPRRFLARVMNDESVPLALRIEAAKALLSS